MRTCARTNTCIHRHHVRPFLNPLARAHFLALQSTCFCSFNNSNCSPSYGGVSNCPCLCSLHWAAKQGGPARPGAPAGAPAAGARSNGGNLATTSQPQAARSPYPSVPLTPQQQQQQQQQRQQQLQQLQQQQQRARLSSQSPPLVCPWRPCVVHNLSLGGLLCIS